MPKIINSLKERIKEESTKLFCELGYGDVDMKRIAKACNIAVGTLYNYYPNKKELYVTIVKESWENTFEKMNSVPVTEDNKKNLKCIIEILYDDIIDRRGIGGDIVALGKKEKLEFTEVKNDFINKVYAILNKLELNNKYKSYNRMQEKIANILLANIIILMSIDIENRDENIETLVSSIEIYYN